MRHIRKDMVTSRRRSGAIVAATVGSTMTFLLLFTVDGHYSLFYVILGALWLAGCLACIFEVSRGSRLPESNQWALGFLFVWIIEVSLGSGIRWTSGALQSGLVITATMLPAQIAYYFAIEVLKNAAGTPPEGPPDPYRRSIRAAKPDETSM